MIDANEVAQEASDRQRETGRVKLVVVGSVVLFDANQRAARYLLEITSFVC